MLIDDAALIAEQVQNGIVESSFEIIKPKLAKTYISIPMPIMDGEEFVGVMSPIEWSKDELFEATKKLLKGNGIRIRRLHFERRPIRYREMKMQASVLTSVDADPYIYLADIEQDDE